MPRSRKVCFFRSPRLRLRLLLVDGVPGQKVIVMERHCRFQAQPTNFHLLGPEDWENPSDQMFLVGCLDACPGQDAQFVCH